MGRLIADSLEAAGSDWLSARMEEPYALHRSVVLSAFEHLEQGPSIPGPTFFFAHIILPHPPFIFGPNGERRTPKNYFTLAEQPGPQYFTFEELPGASSQLGPYDPYLDQVSFVNSRMEEVIDHILTSSETPTIIIIQGDHGPDLDLYREGNSPSDRYLERRGPILNAYLLPGDCADQLYPSVTPVNTFRIIFNCYFNGQYELLEDRSYWSTRTDNPPDFVEYE